MGWGRGTVVFDRVAKKVLDPDVKRGSKIAIITELYDVLTDLDWDNFCESEYYHDPEIKSIIKKFDPGAYVGDDE